MAPTCLPFYLQPWLLSAGWLTSGLAVLLPEASRLSLPIRSQANATYSEVSSGLQPSHSLLSLVLFIEVGSFATAVASRPYLAPHPSRDKIYLFSCTGKKRNPSRCSINMCGMSQPNAPLWHDEVQGCLNSEIAPHTVGRGCKDTEPPGDTWSQWPHSEAAAPQKPL